ncbi:hypothetical protein GOZ83_05125 [Agrobacterium vitis]|uniref:hypothetical protein n=1 Tax=Rhizobium/Agrobacterium group TaxID=227290 RepID=UPI0012E83085|nr:MULTISPECIES: hypothetical protein [Rhizobium/Agrobacterium group]MCF1492473.1 hypothetical protein [Allorhizobium ampelinum]MVA44463.1 hypothetical protein [Agrobacterium vitis]
MTSSQSRYETILAALVEEYSAEGCPIAVEEGVTYAHITDDDAEGGTVFLMGINLNKLADQIDRRLS